MKDRDVLENKLNEILNYEVSNTKKVFQRFTELKELGLNESSFSRYLHLRDNISSASDYILYCLCSVYFPKEVKDYFLSKEIKQYTKIKIEDPKLNSPIQLNVIQISDSQWIGKISARELLLWRNSSVINYNENAQRTMRKIIRRGQEIFQITLNNKAVDSVMNLMENDAFIPNTLTFNIPPDVNYDYDIGTCTLTIYLEDEKLDILDGYHRYIAISKELSKNADFDYPMEIRIVQFSESTAQQFIWQEDQKTKMTKSQSSAMNQYKLANQITQRLNDNGACDLYHHITPNGVINKGYFSQMVDKIYCNNVNKKDELRVQKETVEILTKYLNTLVSETNWIVGNQWDKTFTYCAVFLSNKVKKNIYNKIDQLHNRVLAEGKYIFASQDITGTDMGKLTRIWKEIK